VGSYDIAIERVDPVERTSELESLVFGDS
jgi:hypothetical protein